MNGKINHTLITLDGLNFDSQLEADYYSQIIKTDKGITNLVVHPAYVLMPDFVFHKEQERGLRYTADFAYDKGGKHYIIEIKGFETVDYIMRKKMFLNYLSKKSDSDDWVYLELGFAKYCGFQPMDTLKHLRQMRKKYNLLVAKEKLTATDKKKIAKLKEEYGKYLPEPKKPKPTKPGK